MTKEILLETEIEREPDYFYFCGTKKKKGKSFIIVGRAKMSHGAQKLDAKTKALREKTKAKIRDLKREALKLEKSLGKKKRKEKSAKEKKR